MKHSIEKTNTRNDCCTLCGLHKVCSHIMARSDLFICPRESSACHVVSHTCTHCRPIFLFILLSLKKNEVFRVMKHHAEKVLIFYFIDRFYFLWLRLILMFGLSEKVVSSCFIRFCSRQCSPVYK